MRLLYFLLFLNSVFFNISGHVYKYSVNLRNIQDDRLFITLKLPQIDQDTLIFYFPKVVPGTYSICDYGRFISNMIAYYNNGEIINIKREEVNTYILYDVTRLDSLTYIADDTWDYKMRKNKIFLPTGSNFEKNKVFLINNGALFGCFKDYEKIPFNITFSVPDSICGNSSMKSTKFSNQQIFTANDYKELIDAPVLFAIPDTISIIKDDCKIKIAVYHEKGFKVAKKIKPQIEKCLNAIENYWGYLPIKDYTFLFYLIDYSNEYNKFIEKQSFLKLWKYFKNVEAGALEHKHSSLYVLMDLGDNILTPQFEDFDYRGFLNEVIIHEYMHTITPIGLHSYEIGEIDFINPEMSKHLWFYEGVTEYFSNLIILQNEMISIEDYFNNKMKMNTIHAKKFPYRKMSMTEMSENVLEKKYGKYYDYVYTHGALIDLMLDLEIIRLSEGELTLKGIVKSLYEKYGYDNSFNDDDFIKEFLKLVPDSINYFIEDYISGREELKIDNYLNSIGVNFYESDSLYMPTVFTLDNGILDYKISKIHLLTDGYVEIVSTSSSSLLKAGDKLNIYELDDMLFDGITPKVKENDTINININRNDSEFNIPLKVTFRKFNYKNIFLIQKSPSEHQLKLRNIWLGKRDN